MDDIARLTLEALEREPDARGAAALRERVSRLCRAFPIYSWLPRPARAAGGASPVNAPA